MCERGKQEGFEVYLGNFVQSSICKTPGNIYANEKSSLWRAIWGKLQDLTGENTRSIAKDGSADTYAFRLTFVLDGVEANCSAVSPQQFTTLRPGVKGEERVFHWVPLHDLTQQEHDHPLHMWLHLGNT